MTRFLFHCKNCAIVSMVEKDCTSHIPLYCSEICSGKAEYKEDKERKDLIEKAFSRTSICPKPTKKIYQDSDSAWKFIHSEHIEDTEIEPYKCICNSWHVGHPQKRKIFAIPEDAKDVEFDKSKFDVTAMINCNYCEKEFRGNISRPNNVQEYCTNNHKTKARHARNANSIQVLE